MKSTLLLIALCSGDLPREGVDAEIAIIAQVVRIESVIPLPDDFERKNPIPEPKRPSDPKPTKPEPKPSACECGGSGFVTDSANWKRVRCPCGKGCKCGAKGMAPPVEGMAAATAERVNRGVMVSAAWCEPCITIKTNELPKLVRSDWLVNKGPQSHLLVLDFDQDSGVLAQLMELPGAPERIAVLPTFFRVADNKITDTHEGSMTADQIARFVYPSLAAAGDKSAKAAPGGNASGQVCPRCGKVHAAPQVMQSQPEPTRWLFWRSR